MKHTFPKNIKFDLIENGLDFISSGVEHILNDKSPMSLKYAILHLSAGTELLFKEILKNEHWALIFENPNNAKYELLATGDFKSVDFDTLITRLVNISEVELSDKDISILRQLKKLRNKIEHFEFNQNIKAIKSLSSKVLSLLLNFIHENFNQSKFSSTSKAYIENLRTIAIKFKEFTILRTSQIKKDLVEAQKKFSIESCPLCRQAALVLNDPLLCLFCKHTDTPENIAELYAENIIGDSRYICMTDGGDFPVRECIHCGAETFVDKGEEGYVCFNCFETNIKADLKNCILCGQLFESRLDESEMCEYCVAYLFQKDN